LIHTSRPSRIESRYCSPVLIIVVPLIAGDAPKSAVAVDQRLG
jgi:hypothetical protein